MLELNVRSVITHDALINTHREQRIPDGTLPGTERFKDL